MASHSVPAFTAPLSLVPYRHRPVLADTKSGSHPTRVPTSSTTATRRLFITRASTSPSSPSSLSRKSSKLSLPASIPPSAVPYFAYFSNINPNKFGPNSTILARRCHILHSSIGKLPGHTLKFNIPGLPPEPAFATLSRTNDPAHHVYGMLYWLSEDDWKKVAHSEGAVFENDAFPLRAVAAVLPISTKVGKLEVEMEIDGVMSTVTAQTLFFSPRAPVPFASRLKPSRRYVQLAIDGAEYHAFPTEYIERLRSISYEGGPLGGFGLYTEPKPHILDRQNPGEKFGDYADELFSPFRQDQNTYALETYKAARKDADAENIALVYLSRANESERARRKLLYFIPGIEGSGKNMVNQVKDLDLDGKYAFSTFVFPNDNRQSLKELTSEIIGMLAKDANGRPVSILGESMGGALGLSVALENARRKENGIMPQLKIDSLVLINPATQFGESSQRDFFNGILSAGLPNEVYQSLLPVVLLPFVMDLDSITKDANPAGFARLRNLLFSLGNMAKLLPQETMFWRVKLLSKFSVTRKSLMPLSGKHGPGKIGLIASINDKLLASHSESYRLRRYIPNLYTALLSYGGHVPTFDSRFSLVDLLKPFAVEPPSLASEHIRPPSDPKIEKRRAALQSKLRDPTAHLVDAKTQESLRGLKSYVKWATDNCSPIFIGEENIPEYVPGKPVLFVSNHTLLGWFDSANPVLRILETKNVLIRSLAHPGLFITPTLQLPFTPPATVEQMADYGILQVSPKTMLGLMANGRWCVLFPGGAKEALKQPGDEKHTVVWPEEPEFVRACALLGATVVPLSTVGTEDMIRLIASSADVENAVRTFERVSGLQIFPPEIVDNAKAWQQRDISELMSMAPPFGLPQKAQRIYYRFGKPIHVPQQCVTDKQLEKKVYREIRDSVKEGVEILERRRKADSFRMIDDRKDFNKTYGEEMTAPAGGGWLWMKNGAYLDEDLQPPLRKS